MNFNTASFNQNSNFPGGTISYDNNGVNPTLASPLCPFELPFYQTRDTFINTEVYKRFLDNAIQRFRRSVTYSDYKGFLMSLGLNRCQVLGNIVSDEDESMATLEMHHNMLTVFDIGLIITEHVLNTKGYISTFDLVQLLKEEHKAHRVQLVMLSKTPHQIYHNDDGMYLNPRNCFGNWAAFLEMYSSGITIDIAYKLYYFLKTASKETSSYEGGLLELAEKIKSWGEYNSEHYR